jgi:hypothetical protein
MSTGASYAGVWRAGTDAHFLWAGTSWANFEAKWKEVSQQNLRLVDLKVSTVGGSTRYSGVWRAGSDPHYLWVGVDWPSFNAKWEELSAQNLRLTNLEVYRENNATKYAGVWRAGTDAHYLWVGVDWANFQAKWTELAAKNLRLVDLEVYAEGGITKYAGVWRAGNDAHYLWVGVDWSSFKTKWDELSKQGLRLVDLEIYSEGGATKYAGVWRAGNDAHYLWVGVDWENFRSKWKELAPQGLRLTKLEVYPSACQQECLNQVVMPDDPATPWQDGYNYGIPATTLHCKGAPGSCPPPSGTDRVWYRWPGTLDGGDRYIRLSALAVSDKFLTLPFSDSAVERRGIWRYGDGGWHHAGDYSRDDVKTFKVLSSAAGKVIYIGWDAWSGNTLIVSHDVGGVLDAYRTIYMHLRNGADNDCEAAWSQTMPTLKDPELSEYKTHLLETGCPQNKADRNPDPAHWGTNAEKIDMALLGKQVTAGQFLAWAGNTGPGGKKGSGGPNTHLHIFWARRDPINNEWYFFDPYGIYALPTCYPAGVTGAITTPCARYPVAWKGGKPQYQ